MPKNDWNEYKKLVVFEMQETRTTLKQIALTLDALKADVGGLKLKAAMAGGAAGIVATGLVSLAVQLWK